MAFKFSLQIDHRNHHRGFITLCKNNSHLLVIPCDPFQGVAGAACILQVALIVIDLPVSHDIFHFILRNMTALHPACCMITVFNIGGAPVKTTVPVYRTGGVFRVIICDFRFGLRPVMIPALLNQYDRYAHQQDQQVREPFFVHTQIFG